MKVNKVLKEIEGKSLADLQALLKSIKMYKDLISKLGNRGKALFRSILGERSLYKVYYYPSLSKETVMEEAKKAYQKLFGEKIDKKDLILIEKESLGGGIRIFKDNEVVDLSFKKVEKEFK